MKLRAAIREVYGVRLGYLGAEGRMSTFPIDALRNGFVLPSSDGMGVFGSFIDGDVWICGKNGVERMKWEHKEHKGYAMEWLVWNIGKGMIERGEDMSEADVARLIVAVERLEGMV